MDERRLSVNCKYLCRPSTASARRRYSFHDDSRNSFPRCVDILENIMKRFGLTASLVALSLAALAPTVAMADSVGMRVGGGGVSIGIDIGTPPPPPRVEVIPAPRPGLVWAPGYWAWDGYRHIWVEGRWVAERPGYAYTPGHWEQRGPRWYFEPEQWREHRREERREEHRHDEGRGEEHRHHEHEDRRD
jgi:hypothetical protein